MADDDAIQEDGDAEGEEKPKRGLRPMLKIGGFIVITLIGECTIALYYFPSQDQIQARAESLLATKVEAEIDSDEAETATVDSNLIDTVEVPMGEFVVTTHHRESGVTVRVDFKLTGIVKKEDETEFLSLLEASTQRFREQVGHTIRGSKVTDLTDSGLALIKRKILAKSNQTLGKPMLKVVVISDFSYTEQ